MGKTKLVHNNFDEYPAPGSLIKLKQQYGTVPFDETPATIHVPT